MLGNFSNLLLLFGADLLRLTAGGKMAWGGVADHLPQLLMHGKRI